MEVQVQQQGNQARVAVSGRVDEHGAEELKRTFLGMNLSSCETVVLDFEHVTHIGSAGIGKLLLFYRDLAVNGGILKVENVSNTVYDLLKVVKLNALFGVSVKEGSSSVGKAK